MPATLSRETDLRVVHRVSSEAAEMASRDDRIRPQDRASIAVLVTLAKCDVSPSQLARLLGSTPERIRELTDRAFVILDDAPTSAAFHHIRRTIRTVS